MTREELKEYCNNELKNIDRVTHELFSLVSPEKNSRNIATKSEYTTVELAGISTFVLNIYTALENILKQILLFDGLNVTDSPQWHEKVLKKSAELGILPSELFQTLQGYLAFRKLFVYSSIFNIKWEELKVLVDAIKDVLERFKSEIQEYIQTI